MKLTKQDKQNLANEFKLKLASVEAVVAVESGGKGFNDDGKIIIQFEPHHFWKHDPEGYKKYQALVLRKNKGQKLTPLEFTFHENYSDILKNKVEGQKGEWFAFNKAFAINKYAAMMATSVGMMQVMGFNHKVVGFKTVDELWDYAKVNEYNQVRLGLLFIKSNKKMYEALLKNDFAVFASYYNGKNYKQFNYDTRLKAAYDKFNK